MDNHYQILVIDKNQEDRQKIRKLLTQSTPKQFDIKELLDADSAIRYCLSNSPDCILVNDTLPDMNAIEFIQTLQKQLPNKFHNIIMLTNQKDTEFMAKAIRLGAFDYLIKNNLSTPNLTHIINDSIEHNKANKKLKTLEKNNDLPFGYDTQTYLDNYKTFKEKMTQYFHASKRYHRLSALLFIDIDQFDLVTDAIGYETGNQLPKLIADRIEKSIRTSDFALRLGNDQFAVILDEINEISHAEIVAAKLTKAINQPYNINGKNIRINAYIGLCCFPKQFNIPDEIITRTKVSVYFAKQNKPQSLWYYPYDSNN